jgi:hypothetical protein
VEQRILIFFLAQMFTVFLIGLACWWCKGQKEMKEAAPTLALETTPSQTTATLSTEASLTPNVVQAVLIDESGEAHEASVVADAVLILTLPRGTYAAGSVAYNK